MRKNPYGIFTYSIWLLTLVVGIICIPVFWYVTVDWREFEAQYIPLAISGLFYYSFIRLKGIYCKPLFDSFLEKAPKKTLFANLAFLFSQWSFWVETAVLASVFIILPIGLIHPQIAEIYFDKFEVVNQAQILSAFLPILLLINLLAHISVIQLWQSEAKWQKYESRKTKSSSFIYTLAIYAFAPILMAVFLPILVYIPLVFQAIGLFMTPATTVLLVLLIAFLVLFPPLRACSIRKKTIKQIKESCLQNGYDISDIKEPYLSILKPCEGESFSITKGGKTYSCKLIAAPKKSLPMAIHPDGQMHFFHEVKIRGVKILSYKTVKHFSYDSKDSKILIVNPVPKKLMAYKGTIVEIDNGELVGDYKIYNATAFVRAIDNDILNR